MELVTVICSVLLVGWSITLLATSLMNFYFDFQERLYNWRLKKRLMEKRDEDIID
ncbi:hypothetical protein ACWODI_05995 [Facklamia languida]